MAGKGIFNTLQKEKKITKWVVYHTRIEKIEINIEHIQKKTGYLKNKKRGTWADFSSTVCAWYFQSHKFNP